MFCKTSNFQSKFATTARTIYCNICVLLCYVMLCYVMLLLQYTAILIHHNIQYTYDNILQPEAGKPNNGYIYHILKGTRHQYHYAIRLCKKSKQMIQKQKLAENISQHVDF